MKTRRGIVSVFILIIVLFLVLYFFSRLEVFRNNQKNLNGTATTTTQNLSDFDRTITDGTIVFSYPSKDFDLATDPNDILIDTSIPACNADFSYCLNYIGPGYQGTNFETAGVRIFRRADLVSGNVCLSTPPSGFDTSMAPNSKLSGTESSTSVFSNVGDAAAGHYSTGSLYRLYIKPSSACYEFETRIGQSQFANYPAGTIRQFTAADQQNMAFLLKRIVNSVKLSSGAAVVFP